jgi:hypothetical protein
LGPGLAFLLRSIVGGGKAYVRSRWPFVLGYYALPAIPVAVEAYGGGSRAFGVIGCTLLLASPCVSLYLLTWSRTRIEPRGFDVLLRRPDVTCVSPGTDETRPTGQMPGETNDEQ